jgi:hypothetical protein
MIRPFFPKERKRVFIKILDEFADQLKVAVDQFLGEHYLWDVQEYLADKKFKKLFVTASTEEVA